MQTPRTSRVLFPRWTASLVSSALLVAGLVTNIQSANAEERATAAVGSFGVGGAMTAGINENTGKFSTQFPVAQLPGVPGSDRGAFELGVSYRQDAGEGGENRYNLGPSWTWNMTYVDTNGGLRVFPVSGGMFDADASKPSGLARYTLGDLVFSQTEGVLPAREGINGEISYAYILEYAGGNKDYFNSDGNLIARIGSFGERVDLLWGTDNRLAAVVDASGSQTQLNWTETGVEVISPERSDGFGTQDVAKTVLKIAGNDLTSITNPVGEEVEFRYEDAGRVAKIISNTGVVTELSYQSLPDNSIAVERARVSDSKGVELSHREWKIVGEHTSSGSPAYQNAQTLWSSGDNNYRYRTVLSDGFTDVMSEYNSLGLMILRDVVVTTGSSNVAVRKQQFTFEGTEDGGVPQPDALPKQYAKPIQTVEVFQDGLSNTRKVTEHSEFDDTGRLIKHTGADGATTETVYDSYVPEGAVLPIGLVLEETTTGADGSVSKTVNTLTSDHKAIAAAETFTNTPGSKPASVSRTEFTVEPDGFVSEQKVIATGTVSDGPREIVDKFSRDIDRTHHTATLTHTEAAGTDAKSTTSTVIDLSSGLPVSTIDATGRVANVKYDRLGRAVDETDFSGLHTKTTYDKNVTRVTDPQGVTRSEYRDVLGQVVKVTDNITTIDGVATPDPKVERRIETRKYEQNSSKMVSTDARGLETTTVSDVLGRPIKTTSPSGITQITEYDDVANTTTTGIVPRENASLSEALRVTTQRNDDSNRAVSVEKSRKDKVQVPQQTTQYDGLGRVTKQTSNDVISNVTVNPDGTAKTTKLTPANTSAFPGKEMTMDREHDVMGVSTKKTLSQAGEKREGVSRVLDAAGHTKTQTDQAQHTTTFVYAPDGLVLESRNNGTGIVIHNTYDQVTRDLIATETVGSDGSVAKKAFEYDAVTGDMVSTFDPSDRAKTEIRYTYDVMGNTTSIRYPDGKTLSHVFDENGRELSSIDTAGNITQFDYNKYGVMTRAQQTTPDGTVLSGVEYAYDAFGRVVKLSRDNGVTTEYSFTSGDAIAHEKTTHNNAVITDSHYSYDTHGNLVQRVDKREIAGLEQTIDTAAEAETGFTTETTTYTYDAYNRLTSSSVFAGETPAGQLRSRTEYDINLSGDVAKETTTRQSGDVSVREFEYNTLGHLIAITTDGKRVEQKFDNAGNLTEASDGTRYVYNTYNQPVTETRADGTVVENTYWVTGKRNTTTTTTPNSAESTGMYWDENTIINDTHTANDQTTTASYLIASTARYTRTFANSSHTADTEYYVSDRHGNTVAMVDGNGDTTHAYAYSDYGVTATRNLSQNSDSVYNPFQFAGEYTTPFGAQLLGARMYDPRTMRFGTQDIAPLYNLYAYANANPITLSDPSGQNALPDILVTGLSVLAFAMAVGSFVSTFATAGIPVIAAYITRGLAFADVLSIGGIYVMNATSFQRSDPETAATIEKALLGIGLATGVLASATAIWGWAKRDVNVTHVLDNESTKEAQAFAPAPGPRKQKPTIEAADPALEAAADADVVTGILYTKKELASLKNFTQTIERKSFPSVVPETVDEAAKAITPRSSSRSKSGSSEGRSARRRPASPPSSRSSSSSVEEEKRSLTIEEYHTWDWEETLDASSGKGKVDDSLQVMDDGEF